ncbi:hypothetical protein D3C73_1336580 [compost metagenome]
MEEFFLSLLFTGNKLQVVHYEDVNVAILVRETFLFETNAFKEFFHEGFRTDIQNTGVWLLGDNLISNRLHKVSLT